MALEVRGSLAHVLRMLIRHCIAFMGTTLLGALTMSGDALHWLKNEHLEAAFSVEEGMRLAVFQKPDGENIFKESDDPCRGLKTWIMMPSDIIGIRDMLSEETAEVTSSDDTTIRMTTLTPNKWGLALEWAATLEASGESVQLIQRVHNRSEDVLHLGLWSIGAFSPGTVLSMPYDRSPSLGKNHPNQVAVFPYTDFGDSRIRNTRENLQVQLWTGDETGSIKLGIVQPQGRVQAIRDGQVFEMQSPCHADALYPEGGMIVTVSPIPFTFPGSSRPRRDLLHQG